MILRLQNYLHKYKIRIRTSRKIWLIHNKERQTTQSEAECLSTNTSRPHWHLSYRYIFLEFCYEYRAMGHHATRPRPDATPFSWPRDLLHFGYYFLFFGALQYRNVDSGVQLQNNIQRGSWWCMVEVTTGPRVASEARYSRVASKRQLDLGNNATKRVVSE